MPCRRSRLVNSYRASKLEPVCSVSSCGNLSLYGLLDHLVYNSVSVAISYLETVRFNVNVRGNGVIVCHPDKQIPMRRGKETAFPPTRLFLICNLKLRKMQHPLVVGQEVSALLS